MYVYRTRAIITRGWYVFLTYFSVVYIVERLVLQTIFVLNKKILQFLGLKYAVLYRGFYLKVWKLKQNSSLNGKNSSEIISEGAFENSHFHTAAISQDSCSVLVRNPIFLCIKL